ncbi:MAG: ATP-binding cassette domain-containing protein [Ignavibacteriaceae bacterium]
MIDVSLNDIKILNENYSRTLLLDIYFKILPNNIYTILGLNGTGKSTLIKSLTKLLDEKFYKVEGKIFFDGINILSLSNLELQKFREEKVKYVFQDAINSFDHFKTIGYYFEKFAKKSYNFDEVLEYFILPKSERLFKMYPYELSGGMAQRTSLALALLTNPQLLILDEPTSGIDSAISNLYLHKLKEFASQNNNSVLLVTQDLSFAKIVSNKIAYLHNETLSEFYNVSEFFDTNLNSSFQKFVSSYQTLAE